MSSNKMATKSDLQEMYSRILPYLGGSADAGFTPVGTIISVMGVNAPANYLKCDGTVYNIADYSELANYFYQQFGSKNKFGGDGTTTFGIPDLRGEFLRGTGTNGHSGEGSGAAVGTHQGATRSPYFIYYNGDDKIYMSGKSVGAQPANEDSRIGYNSTTGRAIYNSSSTDTYIDPDKRVTYTSRPTNTSVLFCIATKNIYLNPENDYSTDEKVIGTWIDGKTIYQKCIEIPETIPTANTTLSIILTAPANVDKYVYLGGWMSTGEAAYNSIPFSYEDTWFARLCGIETSSRHEILFNCRTTNTNAIRGVAIVQYTKTTS